MKGLIILFYMLFVPVAMSATAEKVSVDALGLKPEAISAKAILEDLLVRRYSQGLSTFMDKQGFTVGVQLILDEKPMPTEKAKNNSDEEERMPADIMLGELDIETALSANITADVRDKINQFVGGFSIKSVNINIGLKSNLGDTVKSNVEQWAKSRVQSEFGKSGSVSVSFFSEPEKKGLLERLLEFQGLAGQLALAFAILFGTLIWGIFSLRGRKAIADANTAAATGAAASIEKNSNSENSKGASNDGFLETKKLESEIIKANREMKEYSARISSVIPAITEMDELVRSWCNLGDDGMMRLACFSEISGTKSTKLSVPADSIKSLTNAFNKMPDVSELEKRDFLKKIYWDIMMVMNLGSESLDRPFAYVSTMKNSMVNEMLISQNSRMKTLVTMFMPDTLRAQYVSNQDQDTKLEILKQALDLGEIASDELKSYENELKSSLKMEDKKDVVVIDSALLKIIKALSPAEEMVLLPQLTGPGIENYKKNYISLAFIHEWNDDCLGKLLSKAQSDEVIAYLRIKPEFRERFIGLCPTMTAEVTTDELSREDRVSEKDRNNFLRGFLGKLEELVSSNEVDLSSVFKVTKLKLVEESDHEDQAA